MERRPQEHTPHEGYPREDNFTTQFLIHSEDLIEERYTTTRSVKDARLDSMRFAAAKVLDIRLQAFLRGGVAYIEEGAEAWDNAINDALDHNWDTMINEMQRLARGFIETANVEGDERDADPYTNLIKSLKGSP